MTTAIASNGGRCHSVVLTERYARPPRVARTHHRRSHSKLSETQFREGFSAPRYPPNVPPPHPTLDLWPERGSPPPTPPWTLAANVGGGGGTMRVHLGGVPWQGTFRRSHPPRSNGLYYRAQLLHSCIHCRLRGVPLGDSMTISCLHSASSVAASMVLMCAVPPGNGRVRFHR